MSYHQVRILHEAEDDLVEYRSKVRFEFDRDPLTYEPNYTSTDQLVPGVENRGTQIHRPRKTHKLQCVKELKSTDKKLK